MKKPSRHLARRYAVQAIYQWQMNDGPMQEIQDQFLEQKDPEKFDTTYFSTLILGVGQEKADLDALLSPLSSRELAQVDPIELAVLRLATYELKYCIQVPYRVVLNEALELNKVFGTPEGHKFVNGILDKLAKQLRSAETT